jgi:dihydropteroate synthase
MAVRNLVPLRWGEYVWDWTEKTRVMAIINATSDSFSGDGIGANVARAIELAERAVEGGADVIDLGGESTRPGHAPITAAEELARVVPLVEAIAKTVSIPISIDTSKAVVAEAAIAAGASIVNDVRGFTRDPDLAAVVARHGLPAVVMHDIEPDPGVDIMTSIVRELFRRLDRAVAAGMAWNRLIVDPGIGFGKDWRQNLDVLRRLSELRVLDRPILVGFSRKRTIGRVLGAPEHDRLEGTLATTALAIANGANIVRVHDVAANVRVARMTDAVVHDLTEEQP